MHSVRHATLTAALVGIVALTTTLTGCTSETARPSARDVAIVTPAPLPANFCDLATEALPNGWVLDEVKSDPYDNEALGISATCSLGTGYEGETHTTVLVTWNPQPTVEDSDEALVKQCDRVSRISTGFGASTQRDSELCQSVDDGDVPEWTLLAYTDPERTGVATVRVDTTDPEHAEGLAEDAHRFAAAVVSSIAE